MKKHYLKILLSLLSIIFLLLAWQCDRAPTQPVPVKSDELSKIPFEELRSGKIVFRRILKEFPDNYYFVELDIENNSLKEITNFEAYVPTNLALSPDGSKVLFSYFIYKGQTRSFLWQLYTLDLQSLVVRNVSPSLSDDSYGAWSPSGDRIAFWSNRLGTNSIWMVDLTQDSTYQIIDVEDVNNTRTTWLPNGEELVFVSADSSRKTTLYRLSLATGETTALYSDELTSSQVAFKHPMISPDGRYVAFVKAFLDYTEELWVLDLNSNTPTQLTEGQSDWHPVWSPDGNKILFSRTRHLFLINKDGSGLTQVTFRDDCTDEYPTWILE